MKRPAPKERPCYALSEEDTFTLVELNVAEETHKTNWTKKSRRTILDIYANWKDVRENTQQSNECAFYLSCLILTVAEGPQRALLNRKANPNFINIKLSTETPEEYLKIAMKEINKLSQSGSNREARISIKELREVIDRSFVDVRKMLEFPAQHPRENCYYITPEVIGSATSNTCQLYLEQLRPRRYIFQDAFDDICTALNTSHKDDSKSVISALKKTKSRSHLALFSISIENSQTYISIVNEEGNKLKMEDWNYIRLIENPNETLMLHEFTYKKNSSYVDPFTLNNCRQGHVVAKMNTDLSYLDSACLPTPNEPIHDRAAFLLDTTYAICMYITLKRLHEDKERYEELLNKSLTSKPFQDPFEGIVDPFEYRHFTPNDDNQQP